MTWQRSPSSFLLRCFFEKDTVHVGRHVDAAALGSSRCSLEHFTSNNLLNKTQLVRGETSACLGFGRRALLHFRVSNQNNSDITVTCRWYSILRHKEAAPPPLSPLSSLTRKIWMKRRKRKNKLLTNKHFQRVCWFVVAKELEVGWGGGGLGAGRWAVIAADWWSDLRCGSRRGEGMTHSAWCDASPRIGSSAVRWRAGSWSLTRRCVMLLRRYKTNFI